MNAATASVGDATPLFHPCPPQPGCRYCGAGAGAESDFDWSFIEAAYCISLRHRADRMAAAAAQFHRLGLCRKLTFFRPEKHPTMPKVGIWESHRAVALEALARDQRTILVLEDDVQFARHVGPRTVRAVARAFATLPSDWMIFFLGHWPMRAWFVRHNVLRTASGCAHAYVAGPRLLAWLKEHPYGTAPIVRMVGVTIDAAYAALPATYAYFPMLAVQSASPSDHMSNEPGRPMKKLRHLITRSGHRELLQSRLMRPTEFAVALCSPFLYLLDRLHGPIRTRPPSAAADLQTSER